MHNTGLEKIGLLHPSGVRNDTAEIKKAVINWKESSSVQRLLDVISSILVKKYVVVAKGNPGVFAVCSPSQAITPGGNWESGCVVTSVIA